MTTEPNILGLITSFSPEGDEGIFNYVRRLALENAYGSWRGLAEANGFPARKKPTAAALGKCLPKAKLLVNEVKENSGQGNTNVEAEGVFFRSLADAICPQCLTDAGYLRQAWSHMLSVACGTHGCLLVDVCPCCDSELVKDRAGINMCDCGFDLRRCGLHTADPHEIWISARIEGKLSPVERMSEIGSASDYMDLGKLLLLLASRYDLTKKVSTGRAVLPATIAESRLLLRQIAALLENYPHKFINHVRHRIEAGNQADGSLRGRLGAWYVALHRLCVPKRRFERIWVAFSDGVFAHFDGPLAEDCGLTPSHGSRRTFVNVNDAAKLIGISSTLVYSAVDQATISPRMHLRNSGGSTIMLARSDCERLKQMRAEWISAHEASILLGIPAASLRHFIRANVIVEDLHWRRSVEKGGQILARSVTKLPAQLASFLQGGPTREGIRLDAINGRRTVDARALAKFFHAVFEGEVRPVDCKSKTGIGGYIFLKEDVQRYIATAALSDSFTLTQLESITGWKYECIARWTDLGLLRFDVVILQGRKARIVTASAYAAFVRTWKPVSEIAADLKQPASIITRRLMSHGVNISGYTAPAYGAKRGGLVQMQDLLCLTGLSEHSSQTIASSEHVSASNSIGASLLPNSEGV